MTRNCCLAWAATALLIALAPPAQAIVQGGGGGGGPAGRTAEDRARELRLMEAQLRVEAARLALHDAEAQVEEGLATHQVMLERQLDLVRAERALAEAEAQARAGQKVSLDVRDVSLADTFRMLFNDTDASFVLHPAVRDRADRVTVRLDNVPLDQAVSIICSLYGLAFNREDEGVWTIMPRPDLVKVGGLVDVPLIGAAPVISVSRGQFTTRLSADGADARRSLEQVGFSDLVDLQLENAPLAEAADRLSMKGERQRVDVLVHDSVPKDIAVTARVYRVRRHDLLLMLAEQAGLGITVEPADDRSPARIHLVPRPELQVSGPGIRPYYETRIMDSAMSARDARERYASILRQLGIEGATRLEPHMLRACPQCDRDILFPDWEFCAYCGAKLPEAEAQAERPE